MLVYSSLCNYNITSFFSTACSYANSITSRSTRYRHSRGNCINLTSVLAIVACAHCLEKKLACKLSSLSDRCGNCYRDGVKDCVPADIPLLDFSKINRELAKLETQEEAVEA